MEAVTYRCIHVSTERSEVRRSTTTRTCKHKPPELRVAGLPASMADAVSEWKFSELLVPLN